MSMTRIFDGMADVPIGSLKSKPWTLHYGIRGRRRHQGARGDARGRTSTDIARRRSAAVHGRLPVPLLSEAEPWSCSGPRRAAINNFGFGGNNAHLLLEEWIPPADRHKLSRDGR